MSRISFTAGLLTWDTWATDVHQWLVLQDTAPVLDADTFQTVSDVVADESLLAARLPVTGEANVLDTGLWQHQADPPEWPALPFGEVLTWVVLAHDSGTDATDLLIAAFGVAKTTDGTPFAPAIAPAGILQTRGAP